MLPKAIQTLLLVVCLSIGSGVGSFAQSFDDYQKEYHIRENDSLPYRLLLPDGYDSNLKYPLILFLHGSGERGNDNELQLKHGAEFFLRDSIREQFPAIVVFPQCKQDMSWNNSEYVINGSRREYSFPKKHIENLHLSLLESLLDELTESYAIDPDRLYIGGLSIGGMGTFEMVNRNPRRFAAAFAICGGAHPQISRRIRRTSWWISR